MVCCSQFPTHDQRVSPNEEVRQGYSRCRIPGVSLPAAQISSIRSRTQLSSRNRQIQNDNTPTAEAVCNRRWIHIPHTYLRESHRVNRSAITRHRSGNYLPGPLVKRRIRIAGEDENIGVQKNHNPRVNPRSCSQFIDRRSGDCCIASRHAFLLKRLAGDGFSSLTSNSCPSACC